MRLDFSVIVLSLSTAVAVSLRSMALTENVGNKHNVRLLCILSGTTWDSHYYDTHNIVWARRRNGVTQNLAANGILASTLDRSRYVLVFDTKHNYSIITISCKYCFLNRC